LFVTSLKVQHKVSLLLRKDDYNVVRNVGCRVIFFTPVELSCRWGWSAIDGWQVRRQISL